MQVKVVNNSRNPLPKHQTEGSAGVDILSNEDLILRPEDTKLISTGLSFEIPNEYYGQICSRSGLAVKNNVIVLNGVGVIDSDYRGEIKILLRNFGDIDFVIKKGDRIAQMVFLKYQRVNFELTETLSETERGAGGFGSTGK